MHRRFIHQLEARGDLDRALEFLPPDNEIDARHGLGVGLTSPELCVLVAYAKMTLAEDLLASGLPDEEWYRGVLRRYFPPLLVERYDDRLESHPLRREIVTTAVVNDMVNRGGITFAYRAGEETGAGPVEVARAFTVVREVFGLPAYWARVEALDNSRVDRRAVRPLPGGAAPARPGDPVDRAEPPVAARRRRRDRALPR